MSEKEIETGIKETVRTESKKEQGRTEAERETEKRRRWQKRRYVFKVLTPHINEETAEAFKIKSQTM